jgi:hypothetical protein
VAVVYTNATKTPADFKLYIGNTEIAPYGDTGALLIASVAQSADWRIGRNQWGGKPDYAGLIDKVLVYSAALTVAQITALNSPSVNPASLDSYASAVAYWQFENTPNDTIGPYAGTLNGGAGYSSNVP